LTVRAVVRRLAVREYAPLAALVLAWLTVATAAGPADAVRLLAAVTLVRAARALTAPASLSPLRMRLRGRTGRRQATRAALAVEAAALVGALLALGAIATLLWSVGQRKMLLLCLLFGPAIAARSLMPLAADRALGEVYRLTLALIGLVLVAAGWVAGADIYVFALLMAARDWLALPVASALAPRIAPRQETAGKLKWREIAAHSHTLGRRRAAYQLSKPFLQAFLGPFGGFAARTGRGMQLDRKFARFVPDHPAALGGVAVGAAAAGIVLIVLVPEPVLLLVAATLLRSSAAAANVLLWGGLSDRSEVIESLEDNDD
jgi:hypothetical protein